jgi:hypothetical protein
MNKEYLYYAVPAFKSVYRVQPGCCFRQVIFEGEKKGILNRSDEEYGNLNSEHFQCRICIPDLEIISISRDEYEKKEKLVMDYLEQWTAKFKKG